MYYYITRDLTLYLLTLSHFQMNFYASVTDEFENIVAKGEIADNEQFLLLPQCFQLY